MSDLSAKNVPIVIATKTAKCLPVLFASIDQYVPKDVEIIVSGSDLRLPRHKTINVPNLGKSFGESYNYVCNYAFQTHKYIIVANDDIVVNPNSYIRLVDDYIKLLDSDIGWMSARSDYARGKQNIRLWSQLNGIRSVEEEQIVETDVISPLFALISKDRWIDYPPINWYSDDIQCLKMRYAGARNFVSTSYVHHVGSSTIGMDHNKNNDEAMEWMKDNEPDFYAFYNNLA
jgi:hypothetical protein